MVVPIFTEDVLKFNVMEIGLLYGSYAMGLLVATPVFGLLSDRIGRKWPMLVGLAGLGAATVLLAFVTWLPVMLIARALQGISAASTWVAGLALIADYYPATELGPVMGVVMAVQSIGTLMGPPFGGFIFEYWGYEMPFLLAAGLAGFDGIIRFLLIADAPQKEEDLERAATATDKDGLLAKNTISTSATTISTSITDQEDESIPQQGEKANLWKLMTNKSVIVISLVLLVGSNALSILEPVLPNYLEKKFDASPITIGLLFMADSIVYGCASPVIGWLGDRMNKKLIMLAGMIMSAALLPVLAFPEELWQMYVAVCALGVGLALLLNPTMPELALLVDELGGGAYGQAYAIYNFFYSLGMLAGPLLGSFAVDHIGFLWGMVACGGFIAIFIPVVLIAHWRSLLCCCCGQKEKKWQVFAQPVTYENVP